MNKIATTENTPFTSPEHKKRFVETMQRIDRVDNDGTFDPEYASAIYALTAHASIWRKAQDYVSSDRIDILTLLEEVDFSSCEAVLIQWAGNLFNGQSHSEPIELLRLDGGNFATAVYALYIRRYGFFAAPSASLTRKATV